MAKMGRPPIKANERQSRFVVLRLKPADHKTLERAAKKAKISVSDYIRLKLGLQKD
jgi:predicted HicB family RNase H-like nuclease